MKIIRKGPLNKQNKSVSLTKEEKLAARQARIAEREAKREAREAKKAARLEKQRIAKLPGKKMTPAMIKEVIQRIDPEGNFSEKKVKAVSNRIKQIGELKPQVIGNRLRARRAQVEMIEAIYNVVVK